MITGIMVGSIFIKVWNRTDSAIQDITITFLNNFKDRQVTIKKIKPNDFKSLGMPVMDMTMNNDLVLKLSGGNAVVIEKDVNSDSNYLIVVNITGITDNGDPIFTSERATE
ncbi:hypothetical protein ACQPU1_12080 [Clostridium paraputrificum]|uniref:hypothetical protein n=1 Tax=Clostridium paraputrificum TaxID=29363 RepID=UPI003D32C681